MTVLLRLVAAVAVSLIAAGCGSGSGSDKQLPDGGPCELISASEIGDELGVTTLDKPGADGKEFLNECSYLYRGGVQVGVTKGEGPPAAGEEITFKGHDARRQTDESSCDVDVWLTPGEESQRFGAHVLVFATNDSGLKPCDAAERVLTRIYDKLE